MDEWEEWDTDPGTSREDKDRGHQIHRYSRHQGPLRMEVRSEISQKVCSDRHRVPRFSLHHNGRLTRKGGLLHRSGHKESWLWNVSQGRVQRSLMAREWIRMSRDYLQAAGLWYHSTSRTVAEPSLSHRRLPHGELDQSWKEKQETLMSTAS